MKQILEQIESCTTFVELKAIANSVVTRTDLDGIQKLTIMNAISRKKYTVVYQ